MNLLCSYDDPGVKNVFGVTWHKDKMWGPWPQATISLRQLISNNNIQQCQFPSDFILAGRYHLFVQFVCLGRSALIVAG